MLVLSRKMDEEIVIGDEIRITVLRVKGDRVKLGIQAGDNVKIMRGELLDGVAQFQGEGDADSPHAIADPSAGLVDDEFVSDGMCPPDGWEGFLGPTRPDARPAWLTICCCS